MRRTFRAHGAVKRAKAALAREIREGLAMTDRMEAEARTSPDDPRWKEALSAVARVFQAVERE
jgi:hypothetical protein